MKILIVHNYYQQMAGEDAVVSNEMALLRSHGHDVRLFSAHNDEIRTVKDRIEICLSVAYNLSARDRLRKVVDDFRPDVAHVHNFFPQLTPAVFDAFRSAGVPAAFTLHNSESCARPVRSTTMNGSMSAA
jgi:Glycosyl transferase 4-like domain